MRKDRQRLDVRAQRTGRSRGARKRRNKAAKGDRPLPRQWAPRAALGPGAESRPQPAEPADLGPSARMGVLRALESRMTPRKAPARGPARCRGYAGGVVSGAQAGLRDARGRAAPGTAQDAAGPIAQRPAVLWPRGQKPRDAWAHV